jgi:multisubunit Na+/H+ antiporter MnhE subunit
MHDQGQRCSCPSRRDEKSTHGGRRFLTRWLVGNSTIAAVFALLWLLLRSGARPSRLAYPCQQAALTSAGLALGAPLAAAVVAARRGLITSMRRPARVIAAILGVIAMIAVWGHISARH